MIPTATGKKAVLYCRVSSKEQEESGYSLDAQEKLLKDYAVKTSVVT
jgi:DNA invertase Pin-like site-specific DNA recombinase